MGVTRYGTRVSMRRRDVAAARAAAEAGVSLSDGVLSITARGDEGAPKPVGVTPEPEPEPIDYASMTVSELKDIAALVHGLDVPSRIRKADLIELIKTSI